MIFKRIVLAKSSFSNIVLLFIEYNSLMQILGIYWSLLITVKQLVKELSATWTRINA